MSASASLPNYLQPFRVFTRPFPEEAVADVVTRKDEAIPELLRVLAEFPARWVAGDVEEDAMLHEYAMQLLAEFRESRAYRPVVRIARIPETDDVLGDSVTDSLPKILAAVWDGDSEPLYDLIGDPAADEFARSAGIAAIGILYQEARLDRIQLREHLAEIYEFRLEKQPMFPWDAWVSLVADFSIEEELVRVQALYTEGLADPAMDSLESVEKRIQNHEDSESTRDRYSSYTTVSEEMGWWYCFSDAATRDEIEYEAKQKKRPPSLDFPGRGPSSATKPFLPKTYVRESTKIGRNDPCPCGSGQKYKKCCL